MRAETTPACKATRRPITGTVWDSGTSLTVSTRTRMASAWATAGPAASAASRPAHKPTATAMARRDLGITVEA